MLLLDTVKVLKGQQLAVPLYLRASVSLKTNTEVHIGYLHKVDNQHPELVISPVDFQKWDKCYRITAAFINQSGLVHAVLEVIAHYGINVIMHESGSSLSRDYHEMEIIVDMGSTNRNLGSASEPHDMKAKKLETILRYYFIDRILIMDSGLPRLDVRPMQGLHQCHRRASDRAELSSTLSKPVVVKKIDEKVERNGHEVHWLKTVLEIPDEMYDQLLLDTSKRKAKRSAMLQCAMICDTRDRLLRAIFLPADAKATLVAITHKDQVGALAAMTDALRGSYDILHCLTRMHKSRYNIFEAVVVPLPGKKVKDPVRHIQGLFANAKRLAPLAPWPTFPKNMGAHVMDEDIKEVKAKERVGKYLPKSLARALPDDLSKLLSRKARELRPLKSRSNKAPADKIEMLERRRSYIDRERSHIDAGNSVFVSYRFEQQAILGCVRGYARQYEGIKVITADFVEDGTNLWKPTLAKIQEAQYFLSVWTLDAIRKPEMLNWLLWELAAASSLGKQIRMVMDSKVVREKRELRIEDFIKDVPYVPFDSHPGKGNSIRKNGVRITSFELAVKRAVHELLKDHKNTSRIC